MTVRSKRTLKQLLIIVLASILLPACSSNVVVSPPATFPEPLVEPLALRLGVHYPEEFKNYTYEQPVKRTNKKKKKKKRSKFRVDIGAAQTQLMRTVFGALFESVKTVDAAALDAPSSEIDLLLVPEVLEFQFSTPRVTKVNVYEIWIKYQFSIKAADGEEIATWVVPVYGKTPTKFLKSKTEAVKLATLVALRDCGAAFITGFSQLPEIRDWLAKDLATSSAAKTAN